MSRFVLLPSSLDRQNSWFKLNIKKDIITHTPDYESMDYLYNYKYKYLNHTDLVKYGVKSVNVIHNTNTHQRFISATTDIIDSLKVSRYTHTVESGVCIEKKSILFRFKEKNYNIYWEDRNMI